MCAHVVHCEFVCVTLRTLYELGEEVRGFQCRKDYLYIVAGRIKIG